jgi:NADPH-dependent curcumin reductase CurA
MGPDQALSVGVLAPSTDNTQLRLAARPTGIPGPECWTVTREPVDSISPGEVLVEVDYLSVDPGLRGWIGEGGSYVDAVAIGAVMRAFGVGRVVESSSERVPVGSVVSGLLGVQEYARVDADSLTLHSGTASSPRLLGALGISGISAYLGLREGAQIRSGDTVLISGAGGAVGSIAGQIARIHGCRVIGIAAGADKGAWLIDELGFDAVIDYKSENVGRALDRLAPEGVDVYFDNVGGEILEQVLDRIAIGARILLSGTVSQWQASDWPGLRNHRMLLVRRASMVGFLVFDHAERYPEARDALSRWIDEGDIIASEQIVPGGIRAFPEALRSLFVGEHRGKLVVEVAASRDDRTHATTESVRWAETARDAE